MWKYGTTEKKQICELKNKIKGIKNNVISIIKNPFITDANQVINFGLIIEENSQKKVIVNYMKYDQSSGKYNSNDIPIENATSLCFLAKNRVLTLQQGGVLICYDPANLSNKFQIETGNISKEQFDSIYQGPLGKFFLKFKNGIVSLFDVNTRKIISETTEITEMKYVIWNQSMSYCALVSENLIFIVNKNMEILSKIKEKSTIKSVCFDENNVLFYTTYFHVKYALVEPGLYGIVKSTKVPIYLMSVNSSTLYYSNSTMTISLEI